MLELSQLKLPCGTDPGMLEGKIRKQLRLLAGEEMSYRITRHAVDARKKPVLWDVYTVQIRLSSLKAEKRVLAKAGKNGGSLRQKETVKYQFPQPSPSAAVLQHPPVVVGFGPAGIFAGLMLARAGYAPIILERGQCMEERTASVETFWTRGTLDPESNIQFGEGGAGTFSDGKLTSNVTDRSGRVQEVLDTFLKAGAPEDIFYEQIPHIGTDRLREVICALRYEICRLGGQVRFDTCVTDFSVENGRLRGLWTRARGEKNPEFLAAEAVILAPGHSARDTIRMLKSRNVPMEAKNFAVGFRVSHPQQLINQNQYGISDPSELKRLHLTPASYKLTAKASDGRGVYSFCMCPGGFVVNASSEPKRLAVNGMSDYKRDAARANSAIVMTVDPRDFGDSSVLDGLVFQEKLEEKAYALAGGKVPVQRFASFAAGQTDTDIPSSLNLCIKGESAPAPLHTLLPPELTQDFKEGMQQFGQRMEGYDGEDCYVIGLESRTSSPVRILRGESGESTIAGLFPCGEGAGYAGGIMSAAVDGIRMAEKVALQFRPV